MGGRLRTGAVPTRLLFASLAAAVVLAVLATAAAAAQGGRSPGAPVPPAPPLSRVPAPRPVPDGVVTAAVETQAPAPKPRPKMRVAPTTPPATTTTTEPPPPPPPPEVPQGKGMWVWEPQHTEGGAVATVVAKARAFGLTHLFVRTGSSWDGFQNAQFLDQLLPAAHEAGLKVYGWDFPKLASPPDDVFRAAMALHYTAPGGHRLDGFAADIETPDEGTQFSAPAATAYGIALRQAAGPSTPLVAVVPNPTPQMRQKYNYDFVIPAFDAVAPMVYWLNREPGADTANALQYLARYGKPLLPIGQAYDGGPEGGRPGVPPPAEILRFMEVAKQYGAVAVSFWSWQHANWPAWVAIRDSPMFRSQPPEG